MNEAWTLVMNPLDIGSIGLALNLHAKSKSEGQWKCKPVIGSDTSVKDPML
jgi:hypothetical protein